MCPPGFKLGLLFVMSVTMALIVFGGSLLLGMASSTVLAQRIDQIGHKFRFPAGLFGLVTALAADLPEITSAVSAIIGGQHELGRGVIFGSNIFNIAALIGLNAVIFGWIAVERPNVALNAGVAVWITAVIGAQAMGWLGPVSTGLLVLLVFGPYLALSSLTPERISQLPSGLADWLAAALSAPEANTQNDGMRSLTRADALSLVPLLAMIVITSVLLVRTATFLGNHWGIPDVWVGTFVIATLTGIPNMIAAMRLAFRGRGAALASEAFNSNTLNLQADRGGQNRRTAFSSWSQGGLPSPGCCGRVPLVDADCPSSCRRT